MTKSEIRIVPGRVAGLKEAIVKLHMDHYGPVSGFDNAFETVVGEGLKGFFPRLDSSVNQIWFLHNDKEILGSIAIDGEDLGANIAHLRWFIVGKSARGGGWGQKLLEAALLFCDQQNFREVHLWTFEGLDAARALYEKFDFSLIEQREGDQWGTVVTEQKFVRKLSS
jgi:GNAT superfamily N-acetyltransferase